MKPILFNTDMVQAVLAGRKTVTRRVVKALPLSEPYAVEDEGHLLIADEDGEFHPAEAYSNIQPGDILYVRETWGKAQNAESYVYKADYQGLAAEVFLPVMKWRPSIHMPKEAARIFLRVTDVRVERLQSIKAEECVDEGAVMRPYYTKRGDLVVVGRYKKEFAKLWDSTVKKSDLDRYGWEANPWVWRIMFEKCKKEVYEQ